GTELRHPEPVTLCVSVAELSVCARWPDAPGREHVLSVDHRRQPGRCAGAWCLPGTLPVCRHYGGPCGTAVVRCQPGPSAAGRGQWLHRCPVRSLPDVVPARQSYLHDHYLPEETRSEERRV